MKRVLLCVLLFAPVLLLSGCTFDEMFEKNQQKDGDDIQVIQDVWPQALDQVFQAHTTTWQN